MIGTSYISLDYNFATFMGFIHPDIETRSCTSETYTKL